MRIHALTTFLINVHIDVLYLQDTVHFTLDGIPIKMTYSTPTILMYVRFILIHFYYKDCQKLTIVESESGLNIAQNDFQCPLIVISNHILVHFSEKVDRKLKNIKSEAGLNITQMASNVT